MSGLLLALVLAGGPLAADLPVAVLVEPGLPVYGGAPSIPPGRIVDLLARHGLAARAVSVAELEARGLDPTACPVLVLPYGNSFPEPARVALRAYHAAGGCLVLSGVPFCHECVRAGEGWVDQGHVDRFGHDAAGIGTGGFAGPATGAMQVLSPNFQPNPLGLTGDMPIPAPEAPRQWLDAATLDPADEVIPLVGLLEPGTQAPHPVSAIVRHGCVAFRGAIDVWAGQVAQGNDEADAYLASQMLVRGVAYCLREQGSLSPAEAEAVFASVGQVGRPTPPPHNLPYVPQPRPWGETFLPKSPPPARRLLYIDTAALGADERTALVCLQGLTSREQPRIWLGFPWNNRFWLDWHIEKGYLEGVDEVADWQEPFRRFRASYRGAVVADPALYRGSLLAANVAACEDLILATPELAERLEIPVTVDLRGRFATYAEGMEWVWQTYGDRLSHHLCDYLHPDRLGNGAFAYDIQWRAPMLWPCGPVDAGLPGADAVREKRLVAEILSQMAPNTAVLGFPYAGEGVGLGEGGGVELASRYGVSLVCTDSLANTCVMSGVALDRLVQRPQPAAPPLERDKVYIALAMSDGDNQNTWVGFYKGFFDSPRYGEVPVSFGMGPPILDLMPAVAQWYYEHAAPGTEFLADVSGIGYIQPANYARGFRERDAVFRGYLDWTRRYLERMDMGTLRTMGGEDDLLARYATEIPAMHSLLADMGRYSGREGIDHLTYTLPEGMPVFRAVTSWRWGREGFLREVREQVGAERPAFVNGFVHCWTFPDMDAVSQIAAQRDPDMVFVTPSQLAALYREAQARGWAR